VLFRQYFKPKRVVIYCYIIFRIGDYVPKGFVHELKCLVVDAVRTISFPNDSFMYPC
jgi:hypothetical protein